MQQDIVKLIIDTASELGDESLKLPDDMNAETALFGRDGLLDSMGLVTLIVAVEQAIEDRFEKEVALADEKALSERNSPYRTVATLASYAEAQLAE